MVFTVPRECHAQGIMARLARCVRSVVLAAALASIVHGSVAWGPITHYAMTCSGVKQAQGVGQCANDPDNGLLMVGSDLPDAFYFVRRRTSRGPRCTPLHCSRSQRR